MVDDRQPHAGAREDFASRFIVVEIVLRVIRDGKRAAGQKLRERLRIFKRVVDLARHIARNADHTAVLHIDIHRTPKKAQVGRNGKLLVPRELRRARCELSVICRQIRILVAGQDRRIPRQIVPHLEIRARVHQIVEHISVKPLRVWVCDRGAAHRVIDEQTRIVARDRLADLRREPIVNAKRLRVCVHPLGPARAGIGFWVLPQNDQQHLGQLLRRHIILRPEASEPVSSDNALTRAVADVGKRPRVLRVIEVHVRGSLRIFGAQNGDQLRHLFARNIACRAERPVRVA